MIEIQIIGNLGRDAVVKDFNGKKFIAFSVADSQKYKNAEGVDVEKTTWVSCLKLIRNENSDLIKYLTQGTQVFVRGTVGVSLYTDRDGDTVTSLKCNVTHLQLLSGGRKNREGAASPESPTEPAAATVAAPEDYNDLPF